MATNDRPLITRKGRNTHTAQSGGLALMTGVGPQRTPRPGCGSARPATRPDSVLCRIITARPKPAPIFLSGRARIYFGDDFQDYVDMAAGDFMYVPPFLPHLEANMSTTEELWWLACRTPENIVVNLPDVEDSRLAGYRRA